MNAILSLALVASCALAQDKLVGGPYTVNVTQNSATVIWVMQSGQASLGATQGRLDRTSPVLHTERVSYADLDAGKTYYYDVLGGRPEGKGSFRTAPRGAAPFEFVLYGDTRTRHDVHRKVIATMLTHASPEFAIQSGDLVENALDSAQWPIYFDIEKDWLRKISFFPLPGNHERNDRSFFDFFETKPYYSFDWGGVHFIALDTDVRNISSDAVVRNAFWTEELKWLEEELKNSQNASMRFVMGHHPPISAFSQRLPEPQTADLMPLFEKYKVTAGLFGHDHNYQHYLKNGVHYIVSGGGGAPLYDVNRPPAGITVKVQSIENFVVFKVDGKTAHVTVFDINGGTIEAFDLKP
jgi:3',5'-cyclic AMP phosphodiesterase CpdA